MKKPAKSKTVKAKGSKKKASKPKAAKTKPAAKAKKVAKKKTVKKVTAPKKTVAKKVKAVKKAAVAAKQKPSPKKAAKISTVVMPPFDDVRRDAPVIPFPPVDDLSHSEEESVPMDDDFKGFEEHGPIDTDDDDDDF